MKHIVVNPPNFIRDAVNLRVVFRARQDLWVFFYGEDSIPATGKRKGDDISARAGEAVDDGGLGRWNGGDVFGDFTA